MQDGTPVFFFANEDKTDYFPGNRRMKGKNNESGNWESMLYDFNVAAAGISDIYMTDRLGVLNADYARHFVQSAADYQAGESQYLSNVHGWIDRQYYIATGNYYYIAYDDNNEFYLGKVEVTRPDGITYPAAWA
eukprot:GHVO01016228.1.p1 GENE.GHVO01016228.1~~GHVO01016228.1.p1  ORF type:complete len:148 (+),score=13.88 GHVO01016228.1:45-446(+)